MTMQQTPENITNPFFKALDTNDSEDWEAAFQHLDDVFEGLEEDDYPTSESLH